MTKWGDIVLENNESVLKQIYDKLKENGQKVYWPGQHKGECTERYIVLKMAGVTPLTGVSSERPLYDIMLYVPYNQYSQLETWAFEIKEILRTLYPMIMYAENETSDYIDETVKGIMKSFQYQGIRKIVYMNI